MALAVVTMRGQQQFSGWFDGLSVQAIEVFPFLLHVLGPW
jgi:hypothetical protein